SARCATALVPPSLPTRRSSDLDVYNPNDYRIRSTRLEVGIDLEGTHFGDALLDRPLDLSPTNHGRIVVPVRFEWAGLGAGAKALDRKSTRLNSSHVASSYAVFC